MTYAEIAFERTEQGIANHKDIAEIKKSIIKAADKGYYEARIPVPFGYSEEKQHVNEWLREENFRFYYEEINVGPVGSTDLVVAWEHVRKPGIDNTKEE